MTVPAAIRELEKIEMLKGCRELVNKIVLRERGTFEDEWDKTIPFYGVSGTTVRAGIFKGDVKERFVHIYYSDY